ncbi:MAG: hypothetical protein DIU52_014125 [bacterium]
MPTRRRPNTISRPTPLQAAVMATSSVARIAPTLAQSPLIHVRRPLRRTRLLLVVLIAVAAGFLAAASLLRA